MGPKDPEIEKAKNVAWREVAAIDAAYAQGELDDTGWHRAVGALVVPAYLAATTVEGGSGFHGTPAEWNWSRGLLADALDRDGSFLDIGCANGLLMESVHRWGTDRGHSIEPHGLDVAPELAQVARRRLPHWADRIHVGNALGWKPETRFDYVRTGLEYVPSPRRRDLVSWLVKHVVAPGGRLIVGKYNEEVEQRAVEEDLRAWGFVIAGRSERACEREPRIAYRAAWIDAPGGRQLAVSRLAIDAPEQGVPSPDATRAVVLAAVKDVVRPGFASLGM